MDATTTCSRLLIEQNERRLPSDRYEVSTSFDRFKLTMMVENIGINKAIEAATKNSCGITLAQDDIKNGAALASHSDT